MFFRRSIMNKHIAVIDIGKTNKKVFVYDTNLSCVHTVSANFEEYEDNGIICERIDEMLEWLWDSLREAAAEYQIAALSITTHGATCAYIDDDGNNVMPFVAYTHEPGKEFHEEFLRNLVTP